MAKEVKIKLKEVEWSVSQTDPNCIGNVIRIYYRGGKMVRAEIGRPLDSKELRKRVREMENDIASD